MKHVTVFNYRCYFIFYLTFFVSFERANPLVKIDRPHMAYSNATFTVFRPLGNYSVYFKKDFNICVCSFVSDRKCPSVAHCIITENSIRIHSLHNSSRTKHAALSNAKNLFCTDV